MRIALPTHVDHAWQALTAAEHTISWLGRLDVGSVTEGSRFGLWHDEHVRSRHTVLQWQPRRLLALTCHLQYLEAHLRGHDLPLDDFWTGYDHLVEVYDQHGPRPNA